MFVTVVFAAFIVIGWFVFADFVFRFWGGLLGAWASVRALPAVVQLVVGFVPAVDAGPLCFPDRLPRGSESFLSSGSSG